MTEEKYEYYKKLLKERLAEKRYFHSLCVADEAERLAEKYGGDKEKCFTAGLLHDITKNLPDNEHLKIFETFGIILNCVEKNSNKLWHALSGAAYVEFVLGLKDKEITEAIKYHTTAKASMNLTEKILYLADFTSRDRDYPDVDEIRRLVDISLDDALIYALKYSINDLVENNKAVHPDTLFAYNDAVLGGK